MDTAQWKDLMAYKPIDLPCKRCNYYRTSDFIAAMCWPCKREIARQRGYVGPIFGYGGW